MSAMVSMVTRVLSVAVLATGLGGQATPAAAETCGAPFRVLQKSFKRLDARNAYVWVDDIESSGSRWKPFQIAVVVGTAYPPFKASEGRLTRSSFDSLMKSAYGVSRQDATVSDTTMKSGVAVRFAAGKQAFVLRVDSVIPSSGGEDALMARLCR